MDVQFYGANCLVFNTKDLRVVVDDNLAALGAKTVAREGDLALFTNKHDGTAPKGVKMVIDMPGEYEISGVIIHGVPARSHLDEEGKHSATIYTIEADDLKIAVIGHIYPELSEDQLEQIGLVDIAVVPVGGNGYTLDGVGALGIIKQIEPKVVIPTHYADKAVNYEVPQAALADALKSLGMEPAETLDKYKPKPADLTDTTRLIVLNRQ